MSVNISEKREIHLEKIRIGKHYERLPDKTKKSRRISKEAHFLLDEIPHSTTVV